MNNNYGNEFVKHSLHIRWRFSQVNEWASQVTGTGVSRVEAFPNGVPLDYHLTHILLRSSIIQLPNATYHNNCYHNPHIIRFTFPVHFLI